MHCLLEVRRVTHIVEIDSFCHRISIVATRSLGFIVLCMEYIPGFHSVGAAEEASEMFVSKYESLRFQYGQRKTLFTHHDQSQCLHSQSSNGTWTLDPATLVTWITAQPSQQAQQIV